MTVRFLSHTRNAWQKLPEISKNFDHWRPCGNSLEVLRDSLGFLNYWKSLEFLRSFYGSSRISRANAKSWKFLVLFVFCFVAVVGVYGTLCA